ncbi:MAG: hypothetical protein HY072_05950 [Deltaproteobacteria bacterium]|nr:hypothetical protein [Deltaproteobacteria bacterium]
MSYELYIYKKLKLASDLFELAFKIKSHQLRLKYPQATFKEIKEMTLKLIEKGCR